MGLRPLVCFAKRRYYTTVLSFLIYAGKGRKDKRRRTFFTDPVRNPEVADCPCLGLSQLLSYDYLMSRLFESFEFLDRGWDVRVLEAQSLRAVFLCLLPLLLILGADIAVVAYQIFRLHHFDWSSSANLVVCGALAFRYTRLIYRRLPR